MRRLAQVVLAVVASFTLLGVMPRARAQTTGWQMVASTAGWQYSLPTDWVDQSLPTDISFIQPGDLVQVKASPDGSRFVRVYLDTMQGPLADLGYVASFFLHLHDAGYLTFLPPQATTVPGAEAAAIDVAVFRDNAGVINDEWVIAASRGETIYLFDLIEPADYTSTNPDEAQQILTSFQLSQPAASITAVSPAITAAAAPTTTPAPAAVASSVVTAPTPVVSSPVPVRTAPSPTPVPSGPYIPYAGNGLGPTQCADGTVSHSSGRGTCSHHGGIAR